MRGAVLMCFALNSQQVRDDKRVTASGRKRTLRRDRFRPKADIPSALDRSGNGITLALQFKSSGQMKRTSGELPNPSDYLVSTYPFIRKVATLLAYIWLLVLVLAAYVHMDGLPSP